MLGTRHEVLQWIEQKRLPSHALAPALALAGIPPSGPQWRQWIARLTLWLGAIFCALALIFFLAYNWQDLERLAKFGLVEGLILLCVASCWRAGLDRPVGKAALFAATLCIGALLALVGQIYQTGADTFELFGVWAIAVLPWVLVGRLGPLWLFWIGLLNLTAILYLQTFGGPFGFLFKPEDILWAVFVLNTAALCLWELLAALGGISWLQERWSPRVLAVASGTSITALAVWAILDDRSAPPYALPAYGLWMVAAYVVYRHLLPDLFVLAGGVLSLIVVLSVGLAHHLHHTDAGAFLLIGLMVIMLSAAGGWWLKSIAQKESP